MAKACRLLGGKLFAALAASFSPPLPDEQTNNEKRAAERSVPALELFSPRRVSGETTVQANNQRATDMTQSRPSTSDFNRAFGDAKKQAANVAGEASDAAQDLYDHASDRAARLGDAASVAARKTAGSFEKALRDTIEHQPYTAVAIAIGLGWLLGRTHRPL
jgi:ElaB/YqjD/DUF883 family membrane-anchored ribosome-binding protein